MDIRDGNQTDPIVMSSQVRIPAQGMMSEGSSSLPPQPPRHTMVENMARVGYAGQQMAVSKDTVAFVNNSSKHHITSYAIANTEEQNWQSTKIPCKSVPDCREVEISQPTQYVIGPNPSVYRESEALYQQKHVPFITTHHIPITDDGQYVPYPANYGQLMQPYATYIVNGQTSHGQYVPQTIGVVNGHMTQTLGVQEHVFDQQYGTNKGNDVPSVRQKEHIHGLEMSENRLGHDKEFRGIPSMNKQRVSSDIGHTDKTNYINVSRDQMHDCMNVGQGPNLTPYGRKGNEVKGKANMPPIIQPQWQTQDSSEARGKSNNTLNNPPTNLHRQQGWQGNYHNLPPQGFNNIPQWQQMSTIQSNPNHNMMPAANWDSQQTVPWIGPYDNLPSVATTPLAIPNSFGVLSDINPYPMELQMRSTSAQNSQNCQNSPNAQNNQNFQNCPNVPNSQYVQNSQKVQSRQNSQNAQNSPNAQNSQNFQNSPNVPNSQYVQNSQKVQNRQNDWLTHYERSKLVHGQDSKSMGKLYPLQVNPKPREMQTNKQMPLLQVFYSDPQTKVYDNIAPIKNKDGYVPQAKKVSMNGGGSSHTVMPDHHLGVNGEPRYMINDYSMGQDDVTLAKSTPPRTASFDACGSSHTIMSDNHLDVNGEPKDMTNQSSLDQNGVMIAERLRGIINDAAINQNDVVKEGKSKCVMYDSHSPIKHNGQMSPPQGFYSNPQTMMYGQDYMASVKNEDACISVAKDTPTIASMNTCVSNHTIMSDHQLGVNGEPKYSMNNSSLDQNGSVTNGNIGGVINDVPINENSVVVNGKSRAFIHDSSLNKNKLDLSLLSQGRVITTLSKNVMSLLTQDSSRVISTLSKNAVTYQATKSKFQMASEYMGEIHGQNSAENTNPVEQDMMGLVGLSYDKLGKILGKNDFMEISDAANQVVLQSNYSGVLSCAQKIRVNHYICWLLPPWPNPCNCCAGIESR